MIEATHKRGRLFTSVTFPEPEADVIHGEWDVTVTVGPESI